MGFDKLKRIYGDLHIHTCLSPCADLEMSPASIVKEAKRKGLDFIGICDHNSAENVMAAKKIGLREKIGVIGGMEITSREEVHILALFDEDGPLQSLQEIVYENLHGTNDERLYGDQVVVSEEDEVMGFNRKMLIGATEIPVQEVVDLIHQLKGLAIASHVDREGFGIIGQLGFIPEDLPLDALELADPLQKEKMALPSRYPVIASSDAHYLKDIGKAKTGYWVSEIHTEELRKCFRREAGRRIIL